MIADSTVRSMCTIGQEISIWCEKNHIINQELADALAREFDSCIIKIVRAGRIKPVLFLSSFSLYYLVIFSDM